MPILPSIQHFITSEETEFEAPASEATMQNIGEAINYLNDLFTGNFVSFTTPGSSGWVVPPSVTKLAILIAGGGGGGGGGRAADDGGGAGGGGSIPSYAFQQVTPGQLLTVTVGAGGSGGLANGGNGGTGGTSSITGTGVNVVVQGATGGVGGQNPPFVDGVYTSSGGGAGTAGAHYSIGGSATVIRTTVFGTTYTFSATAGQRSIYALGGTVGNGGFGQNDSGGGGAGFGNGGNGVANGAGGAGGVSAGGAGGSGNNAGGAGGSGLIYLTWY